MQYQYINYSRIAKILTLRSDNRLFMGPTKKLYSPVDLYFDRTSIDPLLILPEHLRLPQKNQGNLSWKEIGYERCRDLSEILAQGRPCMILWSGGIDSTYILTTIIESMDPILQESITIGLSAASLWENPYFYRDQILPRFANIVDIEHTGIEPDMILVSGNLGDKISCPEIILQWVFENSGKQDLVSTKDAIIKFLARYNESIKHSDELYHHALESADRADVDIMTAADLLWWLSFNYAFAGMFYSEWLQSNDRINENFNWFCDPRWQIWSMDQSNRWPVVDDDWHRDYKKDAKDMIYRLDGNSHYFFGKQKVHSVAPSISSRARGRDWLLAIDADGRKYYSNDNRLVQDLDALGIVP